ncbi:sensor histidine kinase [Aquibacillus sediminis]|uniref:sensor histidine kinase n=1 Tax=Aquibacillus sediminis TaxID=2574734 RepID=UPI001107B616|nr:HAMP domain-containing sensor histidine kinase [Aquibacillus sediminis]
MNLSLRTKVVIALLIVSLSGIFITSFAIFFGVENQFTNYVETNREKNIALVQEEVVRHYQDTGNYVDAQMTNFLHNQAMTENLFYKLYDRNGNVVVDTTKMRGMMEGRGMSMMGGMHSNQSTSYQSSTFDLTVSDKTIGKMEVFYPTEFIGEDVTFLNSIKQNIYIALLVTVILSILFSVLFSRQLTKGFQQLASAIQKLRDHEWRVRLPVEGLAPEMKDLGESFNELAESLLKEESLRKQFTADFAHELRTPLATLRSQLEAYQDGIWEPTLERLQKSHGELMRLVRLVNELEKLIAAENPQVKLNKTEVEVGALLNLLEHQFHPAFLDKGVMLSVQQLDQQLYLQVDRDKIIQILTNVINNALQYTPSGRSVTVKMNESEKYVGFIIQDQGTGIHEEDLPYLFERFYRGDKSRDRATGGIGIGLSIVKALVDAHRGIIEVDSEVGIGTTFRIWLPR